MPRTKFDDTLPPGVYPPSGATGYPTGDGVLDPPYEPGHYPIPDPNQSCSNPIGCPEGIEITVTPGGDSLTFTFEINHRDDQTHNVLWDFGDGTTLVAPANETPSHTYATPGEYDVTATCHNQYASTTVIATDGVDPYDGKRIWVSVDASGNVTVDMRDFPEGEGSWGWAWAPGFDFPFAFEGPDNAPAPGGTVALVTDAPPYTPTYSNGEMYDATLPISTLVDWAKAESMVTVLYNTDGLFWWFGDIGAPLNPGSNGPVPVPIAPPVIIELVPTNRIEDIDEAWSAKTVKTYQLPEDLPVDPLIVVTVCVEVLEPNTAAIFTPWVEDGVKTTTSTITRGNGATPNIHSEKIYIAPFVPQGNVARPQITVSLNSPGSWPDFTVHAYILVEVYKNASPTQPHVAQGVTSANGPFTGANTIPVGKAMTTTAPCLLLCGAVTSLADANLVSFDVMAPFELIAKRATGPKFVLGRYITPDPVTGLTPTYAVEGAAAVSFTMQGGTQCLASV